MPLKFNEKSRYSEEFIFITELLYNIEKAVHIKEKLYNLTDSENNDNFINELKNFRHDL